MTTPVDEIAIDVPDQPRVGAVVLDRYWVAWQRIGSHWVRAGALLVLMGRSEDRMAWADLLVHRGPVRVIWRPEDAK